MTTELYEYLMVHAVRGDCTCGKCIDASPNPRQPNGHTVDVHFFRVAVAGKPSAERLRVLIADHKGEFAQVNPFDGQEHSYIELGAWLGDQGWALTLMGLGALLNLWKLTTPRSVFGDAMLSDLMDNMAGIGLVTVRALK